MVKVQYALGMGLASLALGDDLTDIPGANRRMI
jgi:hypothetical protein